MRLERAQGVINRALVVLGLLPLLLLSAAALERPFISPMVLVPFGCMLLSLPLSLMEEGKCRKALGVLLPLISLSAGLIIVPLSGMLSGERFVYYILCLATPLLCTLTNESTVHAMLLVGVIAHILAAILSRSLQMASVAPVLRVMSPVYLSLMVGVVNRRELRRRCEATGKRPSLKMTLGNLAMCVALCLIMLAVAFFDTLRRAFVAVADFFVRAAMWLATLLPSFVKRGEGDLGSESADITSGLESSETSIFWVILQYIGYVFTALLVIFLLYKLIKNLPMLMRKLSGAVKRLWLRYIGVVAQQDYTDVEERLSVDDDGGKAEKKKRRERGDELDNMSDSRARVRRAYRTVKKHAKSIPDSMTAREALASCLPVDIRQVEAFADSYERARYSDLPITREEAQAATDIAKSVRK